MEGQNLLFSDKNKGTSYEIFVPVPGSLLYSYTYKNKQPRTVFYEFIMRNKHEVLGFKAKLWGSEGEAPSRRR